MTKFIKLFNDKWSKFIKPFNDRRYIFWFILFIFSSIGVIFSIISGYTHTQATPDHREPWMEKIIIWFYFTFMSNAIGMIVSGLVVSNKIKITNIHLRRSKVMMVTSLTITMIIFWSLLSSELDNYNPFDLTNTIIVHAITPILAISAFIFEAITTNADKKGKMSIIKTTLFLIIFPIIWLVVAIIIYYSLGANKKSAIYPFLNFNGNLLIPLITISSITIMYPSITSLYTWIYNK